MNSCALGFHDDLLALYEPLITMLEKKDRAKMELRKNGIVHCKCGGLMQGIIRWNSIKNDYEIIYQCIGCRRESYRPIRVQSTSGYR